MIYTPTGTSVKLEVAGTERDGTKYASLRRLSGPKAGTLVAHGIGIYLRALRADGGLRELETAWEVAKG